MKMRVLSSSAFSFFLFLASSSAFASSVCIFTYPKLTGDYAGVICDGRVISSFKTTTDSNIWLDTTAGLKALMDQGYKIVSEVNTSSSYDYTLVK